MNENLLLSISASIKAGEAIMEVYNTNFEVETKKDKSPLTLADKKANDIINNFLVGTKIPIISEENRQVEYKERNLWEECWIVDPLDGTKEFIKRNGEFTVNIALVKNEIPVLGAIYVPEKKVLYFADVSEKKAYKVALNSHNTSLEKIIKDASLIQPHSKENYIRVVGSRSHMNEATSNYIESIKANSNDIEIVSKGSSLKFCLLVEGAADIYPRFAPTMEWDTAAGHAICNAVGINVISLETNNPLKYNKENLLNPYFICQSK